MMSSRLVCVSLIVLLGFAAASNAAIPFEIRTNPESGYPTKVVPGTVLVRLSMGATAADVDGAMASVGGSAIAAISSRGLYQISFTDGRNPYDVASQLNGRSGVIRAFTDVLGEFEASPTDPELAAWWFLDPEQAGEPATVDIGLTEYWANYAQSSHDDVIVVLMDSGLGWAHDEFKSRVNTLFPFQQMGAEITLFKTFVQGDASLGILPELDPNPPLGWGYRESPRDFLGHGTAMAGLIGAQENNSEGGIAGIAYDNPMWIYKVGQDNGSLGNLQLGSVLAGLDSLLVEIGSRPSKRFVLNMSLGYLGGELTSGQKDDLYASLQALEATQKCLVVAASGNAAEDDVFWQASTTPGGPECEPGVSAPDMTVKYPAAFSGARPYAEFSTLVAVGASRAVGFGGEPQSKCACNGPGPAETPRRAWAEYSRYRQPDGLTHVPCQQIVDILAPGGARIALDTSELSCDSMNVLTTALPTPTPNEMSWGWGTSNSSAIVSAIAAGMWSRNLTATPSSIKAKLKGSADRYSILETENGVSVGSNYLFTTRTFCEDPPIIGQLGKASLDPGQDEVIEASGKLGAGVVNAARALDLVNIMEVDYVTGGTLAQNDTFDNDGILVLASTLVVPQGLTLTIGGIGGGVQGLQVESTAAGTEIVIAGTLELQEDLNIIPYGRSATAGSWLGVRLTSTGSIVANGHTLTVRSADVGIEIEGNATITSPVVIEYSNVGIHYGGQLTLTNATIRQCGVAVFGDLFTSQLTVSNSFFSQISQDALLAIGTLGVTASNLSFSSVSGYAVRVSSGTVQLGGVSVADATGGVSLEGVSAGSQIQGWSMSNNSGIAIEVSGGSVTLGPSLSVVGSGSGLPAVQVAAGASLSIAGDVTVSAASGDGIAILDSATPGTWTSVAVSGCGGAGLLLDGGALSIGAGARFTSNGAGCRLVDSSLSGNGCALSGNSGSGVIADGYSALVLRNAAIGNNSVGVTVSDFATADLGWATCGSNDFIGNSYKHIVNLSQSMVHAIGNSWKAGGGVPKPSKFIGSVDYAACP